MQNLTGQVIRGYELRQLIGVGGFAAVYRAYQPIVDRDVAIKVILAKYANNPSFVRRFEIEAQLIARLEHLHIVALYDYWREPNNAYLVMRWLRGGSLYSSIKLHGAWEIHAAARLIDQICSALMVAHRHGIIHQDLSPANILLDEDNNGYLADFGIARDLVDEEEIDDDGRLYGSPAYMAPERILRERPTPQSDIYSLGIVLYELLTGRTPFDAPTHTTLMNKHLNAPLPSLKELRPDLPESLNQIILRAAAKNPEARYPDAMLLAADFRQALQLLDLDHGQVPPAERVETLPPAEAGLPEPIETLVLTEVFEPQNPYKGLRAFDEADSLDFFGRETFIEQMLAAMRSPRHDRHFLAVIGPSGSGKSSVVRAGLLPALRRGALPDSQHWFYVKMVPGAEPFKELETALLGVTFAAASELLGPLRSSERGLLNVVRHILPDAETRLVLVIDQFEELFTLVQDESERALFLNSLLAAVSEPDSRLWVILTLRADFYDRPLLYPGFGELIREHTQVVLPLNAAELHSAIAGPAQHAGVTLEPGLVESIVQDVSEQPGALPLLQYALTELFERRQNHTLTLEGYRESGGVLGALARRAEELYAEMTPPDQAAAQQLFLRLVSLGEGARDTRRRVRWAEIISLGQEEEQNAAMRRVLDVLGKYRLITFDRDPQTREPTVEIAHEALIREWQRLRDWLDENREDLRTQQRLAQSALEWINADRDGSFLATGSRLTQFETLALKTNLALNKDEREYLRSSVALRQRSVRRVRLFIAALIVFSVVSLALAAFAVNRQKRAETAQARSIVERDRADEQARIARSRELAANSFTNLNQIDLALLLSLEALRAANTFEARDSLLRALEASPHLETFLPGSSDWVRSVAFSPDGTLLAAAGRDGQIRLWDAVQRAPRGDPLVGHEGAVNSVAFSPDGSVLASGGEDGTVRLWDAASGAAIGEPLGGEGDQVWNLAFSPDGSILAAANLDGTIALWDVEARDLLHPLLEGHEDYVYSVAFSPDGSRLASGSADGTIRFWDVATGEPDGDPLAAHNDEVRVVAFSPDGTLLASGSSDRTIRLWDVAQQEAIGAPWEGHTGRIRSLTFSLDGQRLISGGDDDVLRLWDVASGQALGQPLTGQGGNVWSLALSSDGQTVASGGEDTRVVLWNLAGLNLADRVLAGHTETVESVAFSPDGMLLASGGGSPRGGGSDNTVRLWEVKTGKLLATLQQHLNLVTRVVFSPDGKTLASASFDGSVILWKVPSGEPITALLNEVPVLGLAFSPDGRVIAAGTVDGSVILWDVANQQRIGEPLAGHSDEVLTLAFSPDGSLLATGSRDATVRLWETDTWQPVGEPLAGHSDAVTSVAFSPDGWMLATASRDRTIRLWSVATRQPVGRPLLGHSNDILSIAFRPDGQVLASGSWDATVMLWDLTTGRPLGQPLVGHADKIEAVAFSPDGTTLASGSWDTLIVLWDMALDSWQARACRVAGRNLNADEWTRYFQGLPYSATCVAFPSAAQTTPSATSGAPAPG